MTIAEKLTLIAQNEQKVYNAGYEKGKNEGGASGDNKLAEIVSGIITEITASDLAGATKIRDYAFYDIDSLTSVEIPDLVTTLGNSSFQSCGNLTSITIPNSVISIGNQAFSGSNNLNSIYITDMKAWCTISFGSNYIGTPHYMYVNNKLLTELEIPDGVTIINSAFYKCLGITKIIIPNSVTSIEASAFYYETDLTSVVIGSGVTSIGGSAFSGCSNLKRLDFSKHTSVPTLVSNNAFMNTPTDLQIKVPTNLYEEWKAATNWSNYASKIVTEFPSVGLSYTLLEDDTYEVSGIGDCTDTNIIIPSVYDGKAVTSIRESAFDSGEIDLTSVVIGNNVRTIGNYAFEDCANLTSVVMGDNVNSIGDYVFSICPNLSNVVIPEVLDMIGEGAFDGCESLKRLDFSMHSSVPQLGWDAFAGCHDELQIRVPADLIDEWKSATNWSAFADKIVTEFTN